MGAASTLAKLKAAEADATFLAAAGLDRLGEDDVGVRLDPQVWLPAPAQAAIGIECRRDDARTRESVSTICPESVWTRHFKPVNCVNCCVQLRELLCFYT